MQLPTLKQLLEKIWRDRKCRSPCSITVWRDDSGYDHAGSVQRVSGQSIGVGAEQMQVYWTPSAEFEFIDLDGFDL